MLLIDYLLKRFVKDDPAHIDLNKDVKVTKSPFPRKRSCTDVPCLFLLFLFVVVLIGLLVYCIKNGDIARIIMGYDRCGNICGQVTERLGIAPNDPKYNCFGADMRKYRFLLVTGAGLREQNDANINRMCLESCKYYPDFREFNYRCIPKKVNQRHASYTHNGYSNSSGGSAGHSGGGGWGPPVQPLTEAVPGEPKRRNVSVPVLKKPPHKVNRTRRHSVERRLIQYHNLFLDPTDRVDVYFSKTGFRNFFQEVAEDLELCWQQLLALFFIALGFTLVLMLSLILAVKVVVILSMVVGIVVGLTTTAYLWAKGGYEIVKRTPFNLQSMGEIENRFIHSYLGYAIASTFIFIILIMVLYVTRKRLGLVIRLSEESGRAISDMPELLILPWVCYAISGGLIAGWFYLALWIESSGKLVSENNVNFVYAKDAVVHVARWCNLVAIFWLVQFVMACQHLVVAGAVGDWYFSRHKLTTRQPVDWSLKRTIRYHLGTAVFGATLVEPLHFVRVFFLQVSRWIIPKIPLHFSACIRYPFVKFVSFISSKAYVEVALTGCNFIEGGRRVMRLIDKFDSDFNSAGEFLLMSKVTVMLGNMLVAIAFFQDKEGVLHVWVLVALAGIFGYTVAHILITVYEEFVDESDQTKSPPRSKPSRPTELS